jgi:hypothetical protein
MPNLTSRATSSFGCWNVRSMCDDLSALGDSEATTLVLRDLTSYKVQYGVLTEGHWVGDGIRVYGEGDYTVIYTGHPELHRHGVGVVLNRDWYTTWREAGGHWLCVLPGRLLTVRLPIEKDRFMTIVGVYAPTNVNGHEQETEELYIKLRETIDKIPATDLLIMAGDFNARVGRSEVPHECVGRWAPAETNDNGKHLTALCEDLDLAIMGTFFPHKDVHKLTWRHAATSKWFMIDHVIVRNKHKGRILDVKAHNGTLHQSDHRLVRVKLQLNPRPRRKRQQVGVRQLPHRYDKTQFKNPSLRNEYVRTLRDEGVVFEDHLDKPDVSLDERFCHFQDAILGVHKVIYKDNKPIPKGHKAWMSWETFDLVEGKRAFYRQLCSLDKNSAEYAQVRQKYDAANKAVKKAVTKDKNSYVHRHTRALEYMGAKGHPLFFAVKDRLFKEKKPVAVMVRDDDGRLIESEEKKVDRWAAYFEGLLNVDSQVDFDAAEVSPNPEWRFMGREKAPPDTDEVRAAIRALRTRRAADKHGIIAEVLKHGDDYMVEQILRLVTELWLTKKVPQTWGSADLTPLFKKGDASVCDNYRGIAILDIISKVQSNILLARLQERIKGKLLEAQAGFLEGRGCDDLIFTLRMLTQYANEFNKPMYACFIDFKKAYDCINRDALWTICKRYGVDGELLDMMMLMYNDTTAKVKTAWGPSREFSLRSGVKQGCVLSPLLFNIFLDHVMRTAITRGGYDGLKVHVGDNGCWRQSAQPQGRAVRKDEQISTLLYADDTTLLASSYEELCRMVQVLELTSQRYGMTISVTKTKVMAFAAPADEVRAGIVLRGESIEEVAVFKFLGSLITSDGKSDTEIHKRIRTAKYSFVKLKAKLFSKPYFSSVTKTRVYKVQVLPALMYACSSWSVSAAMLEKLEVQQMKFIRSMFKLKRTDRASNDSIRQKYGLDSIQDLLYKSRLRWFGKVMRMEDERLPKQVLCGTLYDHGDKRSGGRGRVHWTGNVETDLGRVALPPHECVKVAQDAEAWTKLVAEAFADKQTLKCPFPGCSFEAETQGGRRRHIRMQHIEATLEQAQAADDLIRLLA